jgi:hypothetical protein
MLQRFTLSFLLLIGLSVPAAAQTVNDLAGSYLYRFAWGGTELTLKENGTFVKESSDCTQLYTLSGPYSVRDDTITLTAQKMWVRSLSEKKNHDVTTRKARKKYLDEDEPFKVETWELKIVRWSERIYLMNSESFESFVGAINLGYEPREVDGYHEHYGPIYLRVGDENKPVNGPPPLPKEFLDLILPTPVIATVVEVETNGNNTIATIDRGSADGLRKSMSLVTVDDDYFMVQTHWIISVEPHTSKVQIWRDIKLGDKLTTRIANVRQFAE